MTEEFSQKDLQKAMFMNLVIMLSTTVMQQLGKLVNPLTKKTEVDLQGAQATIDMLTMLEAKTKGNLDEDEERLLKQSLSTVQMNYVETASAQPANKPGAKTAQAETNTGETKKAADSKDPKYHKSYE